MVRVKVTYASLLCTRLVTTAVQPTRIRGLDKSHLLIPANLGPRPAGTMDSKPNGSGGNFRLPEAFGEIKPENSRVATKTIKESLSAG